MNASQQLNHINENSYDDDITVTDVPKGQFLAVTANSLPDGSDTREISVELLPLEQAPGGTRIVNTGLYIRKENERSVKVTVMENGKELAANTTNYS